MSDTVTVLTHLNGYVKSKQGKFQDPLYEASKFTDALGPLQPAKTLGREFRFPVELSLPQGVTYAAAGAGAFAFEDAIPGQMKEATIDGSQIVVTDLLDYESAAKAMADGAEAYGSAHERVVTRVRKAGKKRIEMSAWYGGDSYLAKIESASTATTRNCVIYAKDWAVGLWTGMVGMKLDAYTDDVFSAAVGGGSALTVVAVDVKNRTIKLSGTDIASVVADCVLVPRNSRTGTGPGTSKEMKGIDHILSATSSIFGIDPSIYELWSGNTFDCGSVAFSLKKLQDAISDAVGKGLDESATCFVSPRTWASVASDQAALRKFDASYTNSKATNGFRALSFYSLNGELEMMPHPMIKEGQAWVLPVSRFMKIGAQDFGFNVPGRGEEYFQNAQNSSGAALAAYRLMGYANLAIICGAPGLCTKITGIVNPS